MTGRGWLALAVAAGLAALLGAAWLHDRSRADRAEGALGQAATAHAEVVADRDRTIAELRRNLARTQESGSTWTEEEVRPDGTRVRRRGSSRLASAPLPCPPCPPCPVCPPGGLLPLPAGDRRSARLPVALTGSYGRRGWLLGGELEADLPLPFSRRRFYPAVGGAFGRAAGTDGVDLRATGRLQVGL